MPWAIISLTVGTSTFSVASSMHFGEWTVTTRPGRDRACPVAFRLVARDHAVVGDGAWFGGLLTLAQQRHGRHRGHELSSVEFHEVLFSSK